MIVGAGVAAMLIVVFTIMVSFLIRLPYLRLASACALFGIAVKLVGPDEPEAGDAPPAVDSLWRGGGVIVGADVVIGVGKAGAGAAVGQGRYVLRGVGRSVWISIVVVGSAIMLS